MLGLLSTNGYFEIPAYIDGERQKVLVQFGTASGATSSNLSVTYPVKFTTKVFYVGGSILDQSQDAGVYSANPSSISLTGFLMNRSYLGAAADIGGYAAGENAMWLAIGY
jgi:hypothetical protein